MITTPVAASGYVVGSSMVCSSCYSCIQQLAAPAAAVDYCSKSIHSHRVAQQQQYIRLARLALQLLQISSPWALCSSGSVPSCSGQVTECCKKFFQSVFNPPPPLERGYFFLEPLSFLSQHISEHRVHHATLSCIQSQQCTRIDQNHL